ncbi:GNAT family N-acetyltransferase [Solibacillus sp. MA9]|uniref:GNAT family N-acetyltransferase n=1 Tax=Solibacillus palustris TaxID=2908203 RepID=A0ABS9UHC4_9BACL|nr:GNAT family N-acetyltransferase [Solibacillus sp. MA9]MCH7323748.1 GNAT family N-acetyltransferase [Solibacillus sp. MA9]
MNFPVLETERLILRQLKIEDAQAMYIYASNDDVTKYVLWDSHTSSEQTKQFLQFMIDKYEQENYAWAVTLKDSDEFIGTIDYVMFNKEERIGEIGYAVSHLYWGKGYMSEAAQAIVHYGFAKLNLERIQARCFAENIGSERVMQKIGMVYEGTMRKAKFSKGTYYDLKMYSILREEANLS